MSITKTVLIGNFLASHRGTKGISEKISGWIWEEEGISITKASSYVHPLMRAVNIVFTLLAKRPTRVVIDTYSDFAFIITRLVVWLKPLVGYQIVSVVRGGKFDVFFSNNENSVRNTLDRVDELRSPSYLLSQFLNSKGYDCSYFPNPVKLDNFPYANNYFGDPKLLWVRGFKSIYQPRMAVEVLMGVLDSVPNAMMTMVGPDGGLLDDTLSYISKLGLTEKITIVGPVANDELYKYMHSHGVLLNTTKYESFGMAVMEAAAAGIPIVSTSVGELPVLWTDGEEVLLASNNSAEEMTALVCSILNDSGLAERLRRNARTKAEGFDWKVLKEKWMVLLG